MTAGLFVQLGSLATAIGVVVTLLKLRPERESLVVSAAHDAVDSLAAALDELRRRIDEGLVDRRRLQELFDAGAVDRGRLHAELEATNRVLAIAEADRLRLSTELRRVRREHAELSAEVLRLRRLVGPDA